MKSFDISRPYTAGRDRMNVTLAESGLLSSTQGRGCRYAWSGVKCVSDDVVERREKKI